MAMHIYDLGWMLAQVLLLLCSAPLVAGIIKKVKSLLQNRIGSSIFQEYFDLYKWWQKPTILTPYTSLVFIIAPLVYFASVVVAAAMLPNFFGIQFSFGDVFVFIGLESPVSDGGIITSYVFAAAPKLLPISVAGLVHFLPVSALGWLLTP